MTCRALVVRGSKCTFTCLLFRCEIVYGGDRCTLEPHQPKAPLHPQKGKIKIPTSTHLPFGISPEPQVSDVCEFSLSVGSVQPLATVSARASNPGNSPFSFAF